MLSKICSVIKHLLQNKDKFVGIDENGNSYYESNQGKRRVKYANIFEPTTISPRWHIWLHYTDNVIPINNKKKKIKRTPNLTGTKDAYHPNQEVKSYYKVWNPNN
ncbi:MAG: NADH-ubiquinone oxidoreductase subunit NDUFA12 family protein [Wolbachia endosymbiont of Meromenopon meropis]|nr:NADH-ubiquinone oxidoreductase subunit NDUFA12 family protein [Wolbachia endosymbiont of Meromenopon meropis]